MNSREERVPLGDDQARLLLARAMTDPARVWAYACAVPGPGAAPVDEILYTETGDDSFAAVWLRHPGSVTGSAEHLLAAAGYHSSSMLLCWAGLVFDLADLVEQRAELNTANTADAAPGDRPGPGAADLVQAGILRWTASYALTTMFHQTVSDTAYDQYGTATPPHDLGELTAARLTRLATRLDSPEPDALIPPDWDRDGWDHARPRAHPILAALRPPTAPRWRAKRA
ncbi:hypothetical protein ACGFJT_42025 [Actinomadura geliboluensis]|uniref:hypothetical protein n=1 Tax=Actinomadura geliboluensis TaxID=882440 RepID=UPI0037156366